MMIYRTQLSYIKWVACLSVFLPIMQYFGFANLIRMFIKCDNCLNRS